MPRPIWSGAISFGLVSVPVKLFPAVSRRNVRFNQLDSRSGARIKQKRVSSADGEEVPFDQIVKGYEITKDAYVVVTDDEMMALMPKASRTIDISDFVRLEQIDPVFYDTGYYLIPDELARKSYLLLASAMEEAGRVAIASFVMRTKQYLAAIRPVDGRLMLSTMVYADELVDPAELPGLSDLEDVEISEAERTMATQLIDSLSTDFEPERYEDAFRVAVMDLIERKAAGDETLVEAPAAGDDAAVVDLLAALEASVAAAKAARQRHPSTGETTTAEADDEVPAARRRTRKRPTAKSA